MDKKFKLPEKWCVKGINKISEKLMYQNPLLMHTIRKIFPTTNEELGFHINYYYFPNKTKLDYRVNILDRTEITFEQFKKYVLEEDKPLVFDKFDIGDIVVSLSNMGKYARQKGSIHKVLKNSTKNALFYNRTDLIGTSSSRSRNSWRLATPAELLFFDQGGKNINDMDKEVKFKVGDFVITRGYHEKYDSRILEITSIEEGKYCYFKVHDGKCYNEEANFGVKSILRKATPEEIDKVINTTTKFEVGKWYKLSSKKCILSSIYYVKSPYFKNGHIESKEYIGGYNETIYKSDQIYRWGTVNDYNWTEVPISEIQQYLPDGHPDKIKKELTLDDLVKGEIYKLTNNGRWWIIKYTYHIQDRIWSKYQIASSNYYDNIDGWLSGYTIEVPTQEEKDWLNACIKAGKFVPKEEVLKPKEPKYEVGDWVVFLSDKAKGTHLYTSVWDKDHVLQIDDIEDNVLKFTNNTMKKAGVDIQPKYASNNKDYFRHATQEEINKVNKPKEMETNRWYKSENYLIFRKQDTGNYGFFYDEWKTDNSCYTPDNWILATDEEVKERLLKYAKKHYPIGTIFNSTYGNHNCKIKGNYTFCNGYSVYDNYGERGLFNSGSGKWAEIISKSETIEKWAVGSYIVFLEDITNLVEKGNIDIITKSPTYAGIGHCKFFCACDFLGREKTKQIKWFATKEEAEEFSKSLLKTNEIIPEYVELLIDSGWGVPKGSICKVIKTNPYSTDQWILENIFISNTMLAEGNYRFYYTKANYKSSTKEAYEAQGNKLKWEEGAYVRYKGTKYRNNWEEYFGKYGVKAGDVGIIEYVHIDRDIYVKDNIREITNGTLHKEDLELITKEEYDRIIKIRIVSQLNEIVAENITASHQYPLKPSEMYKSPSQLDKIELVKLKISKF